MFLLLKFSSSFRSWQYFTLKYCRWTYFSDHDNISLWNTDNYHVNISQRNIDHDNISLWITVHENISLWNTVLDINSLTFLSVTTLHCEIMFMKICLCAIMSIPVFLKRIISYIMHMHPVPWNCERSFKIVLICDFTYGCITRP